MNQVRDSITDITAAARETRPSSGPGLYRNGVDHTIRFSCPLMAGRAGRTIVSRTYINRFNCGSKLNNRSMIYRTAYVMLQTILDVKAGFLMRSMRTCGLVLESFARTASLYRYRVEFPHSHALHPFILPLARHRLEWNDVEVNIHECPHFCLESRSTGLL